MASKSQSINLATTAGTIGTLLMATIVFVWFTLNFDGASSDGEQTGFVFLANWLIFGSIFVSFAAFFGAAVSYIYGLLAHQLSFRFFPSPQHTKLYYRLALLLLASIYQALGSSIFLWVRFELFLELFLWGMLFWTVINQILAWEYIQHRQSKIEDSFSA